MKKIPLDQFGLREGSIRSKAATLYLAGATSKDVELTLGRPELNVLTLLKSKNYTVQKKRIRVGKARPSYLYTIKKER